MSDGLLRNSAVMAAGTAASRVTGLLRDVAMTAALGFAIVSDAYSLGNTLPNIIYILVAGGALNAVFIPQLVRHMHSDSDGGQAFADRLLSIVGVILLGLVVLTVVLAPQIVGIYTTSGLSEAERDLAIAFARLCLPQIFFYGAYTMLQQVLNARGRFAAAMFAPIANNIVAITVFIGFIVVAQPTAGAVAVPSSGQVWWLGLGTTLGVALQALVLFPPLLKSGYRFRFRTDWRDAGLGKAATLAVWTVGLVLVNQIAYAVITRLATAANVSAAINGTVAAGLTTYQKAHLVFVLPHSVIAVSLVTALLPALSKLAHAEDFRAMGDQVGRVARLMMALMVPIAGLLALTAPDLAVLLFGYGAAGSEPARLTGEVVRLFVIGLPAYSLVYTLYRAWYAMEDTRTPFLLALLVNAVNLSLALPLFTSAQTEQKVPSLAIAYTAAYLVTAVAAWFWLQHRGLALAGGKMLVLLAKLGLATAVGVVAAAWLPLGTDSLATTLVKVAIQWLVGGAVFLLAAKLLRIPEISQATDLVARRLRRSGAGESGAV